MFLIWGVILINNSTSSKQEKKHDFDSQLINMVLAQRIQKNIPPPPKKKKNSNLYAAITSSKN